MSSFAAIADEHEQFRHGSAIVKSVLAAEATEMLAGMHVDE
jgi:hypothetical protein